MKKKAVKKKVTASPKAKKAVKLAKTIKKLKKVVVPEVLDKLDAAIDDSEYDYELDDVYPDETDDFINESEEGCDERFEDQDLDKESK